MGTYLAEMVQLAAREAALFGSAVVPPGLLQRRWRQDLDLALAFAQADAALSAKGAAPRVAGAGFPIARVLRERSAAAGERTERLPAESGRSPDRARARTTQLPAAAPALQA